MSSIQRQTELILAGVFFKFSGIELRISIENSVGLPEGNVPRLEK